MLLPCGDDSAQSAAMTSNSREIFALILAGGSGTRFWPASRRLRPKQLLPLGPSAPLSLIRSTAERLSGLVAKERIMIATGEHLLAATQTELALPPGAYLAEPRARNTAPCIAWAARIVAREHPDAVMVVLPSDQHAQDAEEFRRILSVAADAASEGTITTIGIVPTRPEIGYGYIKRAARHREGVYRVAGFVEKPDRATAQRYVESGEYFWNAGIFVFRARDMVEKIDTHLPEMKPLLDAIDQHAGTAGEIEKVREFFDRCESVSIDYGVMEKTSDLFVVPGDFGWSDLGSWESAWELSPKDAQGNASSSSRASSNGDVFISAKNNLVERLGSAAENKKMIALVGVEDLCVIETDDALLVIPRSRSQEVRQVVEELQRLSRTDLL
jgi:mannose-1-phosphate guanylyltransferase